MDLCVTSERAPQSFFFLILPSNRLRERGRQAEMNNDTVKIENPQSASPIQRLGSVLANTLLTINRYENISRAIDYVFRL